MPQLQINQGPQDALLYDNSKSYFTNVGYTRTSNFQMELRDVDAQNNADFGSTVQFVIPKAADLLGPVDLTVDLHCDSAGTDCLGAWVEAVGFAMIDKITFSVGSHDIETVTGDQLNITNELMRSDDVRLGVHTVLKTARSATKVVFPTGTGTTSKFRAHESGERGEAVERVIWNSTASGTEKKNSPKSLIVPLGLFFTKHPSQYFPLAAIAGCNDVRISIKFRQRNELIQVKSTFESLTAGTAAVAADGSASPVVFPAAATAATFNNSSSAASHTAGTVSMKDCRLRCHYYHVTGPEATTLMNKEHVRLLKLWQNQNQVYKLPFAAAKATEKKLEMDLSFLHPVQELVLVIRRLKDIDNSSLQGDALPGDLDQKGREKNFFAYHGGGFDPNPDSWYNQGNTKAEHNNNNAQSLALTVKDISLTLNGQERHPSLNGISRKYLMERLLPLLHSNTSTMHMDAALGAHGKSEEVGGQHGLALNHAFADTDHHMQALQGALDRKEIYVFPFAIAPENTNPSGAVNFSKVSHARLSVKVDTHCLIDVPTTEDFQMDVWGVNYNWLQIKDGRALTSFA